MLRGLTRGAADLSKEMGAYAERGKVPRGRGRAGGGDVDGKSAAADLGLKVGREYGIIFSNQFSTKERKVG